MHADNRHARLVVGSLFCRPLEDLCGDYFVANTRGTPNRCPVCGHAFHIEPSLSFGDAPCPACGSLLWFFASGEGPLYFDPEAAGLVELATVRPGVSPDAVRAGWLDEQGLDSLDVVERVLMLEEQSG